MIRSFWIILLLVLITSSGSIVYALPSSDGSDAQAVIDQLRDITQRARNERAADRWLLQALEDLISQYDWPWREELVAEDFSDGDFQSDPVWEVISGRFWVDGSIGLRSRVEPRGLAQSTEQPQTRNDQEQDIGKALFGALLKEVMRPEEQRSEQESSAQRAGGPAEIHLPTDITNAFVLKTSFSAHNAPSESGELEFGILQDKVGDYGYRVAINTGKTQSLDLVRVLRGRTSVIDRIDMTSELGDGQRHDLEWRRDSDGTIEVYVDGEKLIQANDRSFRRAFRRLAIVNHSGDFGVREVHILGAR